uniref:uncharacterized protein LOC109953292 n=1 Tax=Monopterus albus TaxID=43700 RepID=UPI0009B48C4F
TFCQSTSLCISECSLWLFVLQLFDWSKSNSKERVLTFYRLCDRVAERLKGLFVLFAGNLVKPMSELLQQTNGAKTDELLFDSDRGEDKNSLLLQFVLDCLNKIFLYDTQRFLSRERADALLSPLVDQLESGWLIYVGSIQQQTVFHENIYMMWDNVRTTAGHQEQADLSDDSILNWDQLRLRFSSPFARLPDLACQAGQFSDDRAQVRPEPVIAPACRSSVIPLSVEVFTVSQCPTGTTAGGEGRVSTPENHSSHLLSAARTAHI